jgi:ParB-like chromosome segregation protein Spo0J
VPRKSRVNPTPSDMSAKPGTNEAADAAKPEDKPLADVAIRLQQIDTLLPYARNSRKHSDAQVAELAASIVEWGWTNPVLADAAGIVAGHGRILAARALYAQGKRIALPSGQMLPEGTVPVVDCTGWNDAKRRAYVIADNQLALNAEWDKQLLSVELEDLATGGYDLALLGFDDAELQALSSIWATPTDGGDGSDKPFSPVAFGVIVECSDEAAQSALLTEFMERGLKCRALM